MTTFSVVICAHDGRRWNDLRAAIRSVKQQTLAPHEIVVVVDHNRLLLERAGAELEGVIVVENSDTRGLGGARNSGIAASTAPLVAFLDDDAVASPSWLEHLAEPYVDPNVAGVGGAIEPRWEDRRPAWFPKEFDWVVGCTYRGMPETHAEVRNLIGCNMSYRRDVLEALGRFRLGYGCDETELCIRLHQRWPHMKLLYVPEANVLHAISARRATFRKFLGRCYFEGGSKAVVSRLVGTQDGLASERRYTTNILPVALRHEIAGSLTGRKRGGTVRAGAILAGTATTMVGYLVGRLSLAEAARRRGWAGDSFP